MQTRSRSPKSVTNGHAARQRIWLWHSAEDSAELLSLLYNAQTKEQIDVLGTRHKADGCLTGAEAAAPRTGVLLPSTRALGRVPLTGKVDQPKRKEPAPVAQEEDNEQFTTEQVVDHQPRCEIAKTLIEEGECQRLGEVQLDGKLLCVAHAEMVRVGERSEALLGEVFKMDKWLESADGQADELRVRRAGHYRNELVEQLRVNRTRMELIRDELMKD